MRTFLMSMDAMGSPLAFDRAGRQALDEIALDEQEEEAGRDQRQYASCHHLPEVDRKLRYEGEQADWKSRGVVARNQHQRKEQLAPRGREDEAERGGDAGEREREDDLAKRRELRRAVDLGRLFQLLRDAARSGKAS